MLLCMPCRMYFFLMSRLVSVIVDLEPILVRVGTRQENSPQKRCQSNPWHHTHSIIPRDNLTWRPHILAWFLNNRKRPMQTQGELSVTLKTLKLWGGNHTHCATMFPQYITSVLILQWEQLWIVQRVESHFEGLKSKNSVHCNTLLSQRWKTTFRVWLRTFKPC